MSPEHSRRGITEELSGRSDEALAQLLIARPDLAAPPPRGISVLASRAAAPPSLALAGEQLDLLAVAVTEVVSELVGATDTRHLVTAAEIEQRLAGRATKEEIGTRLGQLCRLALLWPAAPAPGRRKSPGYLAPRAIHTALPWQAGHLTGPLATTPSAEIAARLAAQDDRARELLHALATGSSVGRSRDAAPGADPASPVARLLAADLLARVDDETVELPPQVGVLVRGQPPLDTSVLAPAPLGAAPGRFTAAQVDQAGAGEALELLRHAEQLASVLAAAPAPELRSGGFGIRELRRVAKATGLPVARVGLLLELLGATRLVASGYCDPPGEQPVDDIAYAPTDTYDAWLRKPIERRWLDLVLAWLNLSRQPSRIGTSGESGTVAALSHDDLDAHTVTMRRAILATLHAAQPGHPVTTDELIGALCRRYPRQLRRMTAETVGPVLAEATELGLVAHGALTSVGRAAVAADDPVILSRLTVTEPDAAAIVAAMAACLPEPIDYFLVQADLTVVVPGPLVPDLADQLALVADLESGGAASVYRVTEQSVRRGLDTGLTGTEVAALFTGRSRTPVPQSLTYLIDDAARRHGRLRVGVAGAFVRCEDATQLAEVLQSPAAETLALRALAPTVAISPADLREVVAVLRAAGFAPAGEDSSGALIDLRASGARVPGRPPPSYQQWHRGILTAGQAESVVARMRAADRADEAGPGSVRATDRESTSALIALAVRTGRRLRIGYVDAHGTASRHVVTARGQDGGALIADEDGSELHLLLHRITSTELL